MDCVNNVNRDFHSSGSGNHINRKKRVSINTKPNKSAMKEAVKRIV